MFDVASVGLLLLTLWLLQWLSDRAISRRQQEWNDAVNPTEEK